MGNWWQRKKAHIFGAVVGALALAVLTGALHLPPAVAAPVANALAQMAENMAADNGSTEATTGTATDENH